MKLNPNPWTQIKLMFYSYGSITTIARFDKNQFDAMRTCQFYNDDLLKIHGKEPDEIFYCIQYIQKGQINFYYLTSKDSQCMQHWLHKSATVTTKMQKSLKQLEEIKKQHSEKLQNSN